MLGVLIANHAILKVLQGNYISRDYTGNRKVVG